MKRAILSASWGVLVLGLLGWGIYEGTSSIIDKLQPEQPEHSAIALSAGFVPNPLAVAPVSAAPPAEASTPAVPVADNGETPVPAKENEDKQKKPAEPSPLFQIQGSVQRDGQPIQNGKVRLTVSLVGERFRQSTLTDLKNGEFAIYDHPAFRLLRPKNRIRVLAEVWPATKSGTRTPEPLAETIYLNHHLPSWIRNSTGYGVLAGVLLFAILFLWSFTGRSTYGKNRLAIVLSYSMIFLSLTSALVGPTLLMLAVPDLPEISGRVPVGLVVAKLTEDSKPQWMLNLGGYVGEGERGVGTNGQTAAKEAAVVSTKDEGIGAPVLRVVTLNGGIQIPLYVILLALIGGAINMTRKVPEFQSRQPDQGGFWHQIGWSLDEPKDESKDQPKDKSTVELEEEDEHTWRKGLLDLYMFLVAAPFLAIATYYLLILLGAIQPPIIVLVCFSIGLISDRVVTAITKAAEKVLGKDVPEAPRAPEKESKAELPSGPVAPIHGEKGKKLEELDQEKVAA